MTARDNATLRLALGMGVATFVAYAFAPTAPYVTCILALLLLAKPGPPLPLVKALVLACLLAAVVIAGVLMVPLLEHYAAAGVLLTAALLYLLFRAGQRGAAGGLITILVLAFTLVPVVGVAEQAVVGLLAISLAVGVLVGALVGTVAAAIFPTAPMPAAPAAAAQQADAASAQWIALRGMLIVMPVFLLALTNPSFYMPAILKTAALGQQAGDTDARHAGSELVGSTLTGALIALALWCGLSALPNLWMLVLWMMAASLWVGSALYGVRRTRHPPSYWSNALVTALVLLGPAIEDSASGKSVLKGAAMRTALFIAIALYAWATVWALERWRVRRRARGGRSMAA